MPVYEDKNGTFFFVTRIKNSKGETKQVKRRGFPTYKAAEDAMKLLEVEAMKGEFIEPSKMTFKELADAYIDAKITQELGSQTLTMYKQHLKKHIIPRFGRNRVQKISPAMIQAFYSELSKELAPSTITKIHQIISGVFDLGVKWEIIGKNPADSVVKPVAKYGKFEVWDEKEVRTFLDAAKDDPLYLVFSLALKLGMRQGEILGLQWKNVDLNRNKLHIVQTLSHDGKYIMEGAKTKSSIRTLAISPQLKKEFIRQRLLQNQMRLAAGELWVDNDLVITTSLGTAVNPSSVRRKFNKLIEVSGVKRIRFHDLRHTCATIMLLNGVPVKVVSEILGHSDVTTTMNTYAHVLPGMHDSAVEMISDLFDNRIKGSEQTRTINNVYKLKEKNL